jgi:hypothetical protein
MVDRYGKFSPGDKQIEYALRQFQSFIRHRTLSPLATTPLT